MKKFLLFVVLAYMALAGCRKEPRERIEGNLFRKVTADYSFHDRRFAKIMTDSMIVLLQDGYSHRGVTLYEMIFPVLIYWDSITVIADYLETNPEAIASIAALENSGGFARRSWANCVGIMGISKDVAVAKGLRVDSLVDERVIPIKNLRVGASYFQDLYAQYERLDVALQAYQSGPGNIWKWTKEILPSNVRMSDTLTGEFMKKQKINLISIIHDRKFKDRKNGPQNYVWKVCAMNKILAQPSKYRLHGIKYETKKKKKEDQTGVCTVKKGDTLLKISKATGVPVSQLKKLNNIKGDRIVVGQKLKLK